MDIITVNCIFAYFRKTFQLTVRIEDGEIQNKKDIKAPLLRACGTIAVTNNDETNISTT